MSNVTLRAAEFTLLPSDSSCLWLSSNYCLLTYAPALAKCITQWQGHTCVAHCCAPHNTQYKLLKAGRSCVWLLPSRVYWDKMRLHMAPLDSVTGC